jgi:hypothetical protein
MGIYFSPVINPTFGSGGCKNTSARAVRAIRRLLMRAVTAFVERGILTAALAGGKETHRPEHV